MTLSPEEMERREGELFGSVQRWLREAHEEIRTLRAERDEINAALCRAVHEQEGL